MDKPRNLSFYLQNKYGFFFFPYHRCAKMDLGPFLCKELYDSCLWKGPSCKDGASLALGIQNHPYWCTKMEVSVHERQGTALGRILL